jgi:hypothetical protein
VSLAQTPMPSLGLEDSTSLYAGPTVSCGTSGGTIVVGGPEFLKLGIVCVVAFAVKDSDFSSSLRILSSIPVALEQCSSLSFSPKNLLTVATSNLKGKHHERNCLDH